VELIGAVLVFLLLVAVFGPERKSRRERDMLEAFPADRWTVYPSLENEGKWGIYRGGFMYEEYDTRAEAQGKVDTLF
jgi:hypothetical protein